MKKLFKSKQLNLSSSNIYRFDTLKSKLFNSLTNMSNYKCTFMLDKHTHNIYIKLGRNLMHAKVKINYMSY